MYLNSVKQGIPKWYFHHLLNQLNKAEYFDTENNFEKIKCG